VTVVKAAKLERRKCPKCGSEEVRRSQMKGLAERSVLKMVGVRAYRCETCDWRYYGIRGIETKHDYMD
jgi:rubredoxin